MSHKCHHNCKHENVKYCNKCNKCYCSDCGKEWPEYQNYNYPIYPYTITGGTEIYYDKNQLYYTTGGNAQ